MPDDKFGRLQVGHAARNRAVLRQLILNMLALWKGVPCWTLFFLAGLQGIPQSVIEAAKIDGANRW